MSAEKEAYYSRSWALLTRDKGWWKILLVAGIASFVPIVGPLGVFGYALEWARLTAWGVDASPKQKGVRVGECIKSGWRGFVACLGWLIVWEVISLCLARLTHNNDVMSLLVAICSLLVNVILCAAALRAAVYQNFKAGYQANRLWDMLKADFGGIAKITGITTLASLVIGFVLSVVGLMVMMPSIARVIGFAVSASSSTDYRAFVNVLVDAIAGIFPLVMFMAYLASVGQAFVTFIEVTAVGLWMRNFDVPAWGASADPLPTSVATLPEPERPANPAENDASVQQGAAAPATSQQPAAPEGEKSEAAEQKPTNQTQEGAGIDGVQNPPASGDADDSPRFL